MSTSASFVSTGIAMSSVPGARGAGNVRQQAPQRARCLTMAVLSNANHPPRFAISRARSLPPSPSSSDAVPVPLFNLRKTGQRVACSARKPKWDNDDFAEQVADQVEENIRKAMWDARLNRSKSPETDIEDDIASRVADRVERSIRAAKERPGRTLFLVAAAVTIGSAFIGPIIAAISIAAFFASISVFSSIALTFAFISIGLAIPLTMFSVFEAFALPMLTPLVMAGAVFWGAQALLGGGSKSSSDGGRRSRRSSRATRAQKKETAEERRAREEAEEARKRQREDEERRREMKEELKAFDELLKEETQRKDGKNKY